MCGGMLYRCRSCPYAYVIFYKKSFFFDFLLLLSVSFCEDDLSEHEQLYAGKIEGVTCVEYVGYTIPELQDLGYGESKMVYWIKCMACLEDGRTDCFE
jgi:hypothetical protein